MRVVFSTEELPEQDRFACYREEFGRSSGFRMTVEQVRDRSFRAEVKAKALGPAQLMACDAGPYLGMHRKIDVAGSSMHPVGVMQQQEGTVVYRHDGGDITLRPGDLLLFDATRPWTREARHVSRQRTLLLSVERTLLRDCLQTPDDLPGIVPLPADSVPGRLIAAYLNTFETISTTEAESYGAPLLQQFCGLLSMALGASAEGKELGQRGMKAARLHAIRQFIAANLADPELSPATVAAHFRISVRYLHKLFAETETSFSNWVQQQRLERCRRDLNDPGLHSLAIAAIAYRWGFNDLSHFGRSFRARYGASPRDYRNGKPPKHCHQGGSP